MRGFGIGDWGFARAVLRRRPVRMQPSISDCRAAVFPNPEFRIPNPGPQMNFFEHQAKARRTSTRLVLLFALAVVAIVVAVDLAVMLVFGRGDEGVGGILVFTTLVTLAVIGGASMFRIASLRGGGEAVALQLGGTPVPEDTTDRYLQRLRNVVEETAIASAVPVPCMYVLEPDAAINDYAAHSPHTDTPHAGDRVIWETYTQP